ncbi:tRNA lysidine(34) synthetase TilS [Ancylobacter terrae]|uniref:tRNA lysidine(34) synthetase TilS n=1 Tax=Ancylobacter sp. sgz301288 TaxID=3342077 RepID=UPI00385CE165
MCAADLRASTSALSSPSRLERIFAPFRGHAAVLLAVSGGPDSTALMLLAHRWLEGRADGPRLIAVTVDHGLRPEAAAEAESVASLARNCGIAHAILRWSGPKPASGLQEAAREARYGLLRDHALYVGATAIATAHTLDDQAETVLFRLMRGSGLSGLAGMRTERLLDGVSLLRPLLDVLKSELVALCRSEGVGFVEDPSNRDVRFTRSRLREIMPSLAAEGLDAYRLAQLARRAARADAALETQADTAFAQVGGQIEKGAQHLDARVFSSLPEEISLRVLARAILSAATPERIELAKLEDLHARLRIAVNMSVDTRPGFARTLAGAVIRLRGGEVRVTAAPPRRVPNSSR